MDLLTEDTSAQTTEAKSENGVEQIAIDSIKAFHNHPFHLYEGERLDDMVESIREHGVLNPVIVLKTEDAYEMLSGHNIANAAKLAGLTEIPAIVKVGLSEAEAYVYVIETMTVAYICEWMEHSVKGVLSYFAIFVAIFVVVWIVQYLIWKIRIYKIKEGIQKNN